MQIQWAIGPDQAFHWLGLGLLGYKDTFFSNTTMMQQSGSGSSDPSQWPPFHGYAESNPLTHALMSTLSNAPVTFSDAVNATNRTLVMMTCRADGVVLKPDRPATAIDAQFQAMMFGAWPSPASSGAPPGHGRLSLAPCVDHGANAHQLWAYDDATGVLQLAAGQRTCVDLAKCSKVDGSPVYLFNNTAGCGRAPGTCAGENELWRFGDNHTLASLYANGSCLVADTDGSNAYLVGCGSQQAQDMVWNFVPVKAVVLDGSTAAGHSSRSRSSQRSDDDQDDHESMSAWAIQFYAHDDVMCLTAGDIVAPATAPTSSSSSSSWTGADHALAALAARGASGVDNYTVLSAGRRHALSESALFVSRLAERTRVQLGVDAEALAAAERRGGGETGQCLRLAAPQGPVGEIYTTHTTLAAVNTSSAGQVAAYYTWFLAVGVQVSMPYNLTTVDLFTSGRNSSSSNSGTDLVAVAWSDATTFRPTQSGDVRSFGDERPITFGAFGGGASAGGADAAGAECGASGDAPYPIEYHLIAPVLPNGMVLLGETGKLVPVSNQRVVSLQVDDARVVVGVEGRPGEQVEFGARAADGTVVYVTATVQDDGRASLTLPAR
jgi:hypothetical protein